VEGNRAPAPSKVVAPTRRTENGIKNHFYATLRKGLRRLNHIIGLKLDSSKIRKIKPIILSRFAEVAPKPQGSFEDSNP
jgi:hypothetical protein